MSPVSEVEGYCLRWNNHHRTLIDVLQSLYQEQSFVDVTLAAEGKSVQVHRLVLCAVSPYFQELLSNDCDKQAIIFLKDIPFHHLQALVHYIYHGELVNIAEDQLADLLSTAESLQIKGLTDSDCQSINITSETSCEASSPDSCEVTATTLVNNQQATSTSSLTSVASLSLPFLTTTTNTTSSVNPSLNHALQQQQQQPVYTNTMTSQANNNGETFIVEPKLETENEVDGSAASENEEWGSDADLTVGAASHPTQPGVTAAAVAAAAVAAQSFVSSTPFSHVPWGDSLAAAAAAAAIASSSTIAGPSGGLGTYNIQPPVAAPPAIAPARGKQRNSRSRPSRPSNNSASSTLIQDKPYVCPRCGRCYSRRGALIQHQRYECGIEPQFSCPMCPYKIKRKDSLNRHIRNMHHNQNTN